MRIHAKPGTHAGIYLVVKGRRTRPPVVGDVIECYDEDRGFYGSKYQPSRWQVDEIVEFYGDTVYFLSRA